MANNTIQLDDVEEEIRIARALRDSLIEERESIEALTPDQQQRLFARVDHILDLLEQLESLTLKRAALLQSRRAT